MIGCIHHHLEEELSKRRLKGTGNQVLYEPAHDGNPYNIVRLLKACTATKNLLKGCKLHEYVREHNCLDRNKYIGNTLVSMYAKCGAVAKARQVLKEIPMRDVVSWNALIAGHAQQGQGEEALKCFNDMLYEGHSPDAITFACILKACGSIGAPAKGKEIHERIINMGMLEKDIVLGNILIDMYAKCGEFVKAQQVLKELPMRDAVSWNALIAGYAQHELGEEALKCFEDMLCEGHTPDAITFVCVLKACSIIGAAAKGEQIHGKFVNMGMLENNHVLRSKLVDMYAKCGELAKAQRVLKEHPMHVVCWNALIAGYVQQGQGEEALKCFDDMLCEGPPPDAVTFICLLKACGSIGSVAKGKEIHYKIVTSCMLEKDVVLGNTLVDMYAKCGELGKAHQVLKELPMHDVVSWNALIAGYAQHGQGEEALKCFDDMLREGHSPDSITFIGILKACGSTGAASKGEEIHDRIVSLHMLKTDALLGITLVDMYAKCSELSKAHQVLKELPMRDVVPWTALIAGYAQHGQGEKALKCFDEMLCDGHSPDAVTFVCVLKACGSIGAAAKGAEIHDKLANLGMLERDFVLGITLIDMYAKCGELAKAYLVLKELPMRDVVSWTALIAGHTQHGQGEEALKCFDDMLHEGHTPDAVTFICILKACGSIGTAAKGEEIHDKIISLGMLERDVVLGNALVDMYAKCGELCKAHQVLKELPMRDIVSWNVLISGYTQHGQGEVALKCFDDMLHVGHTADAITFICVLKACGSIGAAAKGEEIHDKIVSMGMLEKNVVLGTALIDMYAKCGELAKAHLVLEELSMRSLVPWNVLIAGYAQQGQGQEALKCFNVMLHEGHFPAAVTFISVLKACGSIGMTVMGKESHDEIVSLGMLEKDIVLGNMLVDMYAKCGEFAKAYQVLRELSMHDGVSWNALISGYMQHGQGEESLKCFNNMLCEGHFPDASTFICVLKACGSIGAAAKGEETHGKIVSLGMLEKDVVLQTTLVDMHVKCGAFAKAHQVLEELTICDVVYWNSLLTGYAQQGQSLEAINCFEWMQSNGVKPDLISLTIVLNACSHSGLLDQAEMYFSVMSEKYGIHPSLEHYCCMIDIFGRAGRFNTALSLTAEMPNDKCLSSWVALLGACYKWAEVKIGLLVFKRALNLDKCNAAAFVLMADIYTAAGMQEAAHMVKVMRAVNEA